MFLTQLHKKKIFFEKFLKKKNIYIVLTYLHKMIIYKILTRSVDSSMLNTYCTIHDYILQDTTLGVDINL